jgi:CheY-like chemotaxis protein
MTADEVSRLIQAVANLIQVLAWPLIVIFLLLHFRNNIRGLLDRINKASLKAGDIEASFEANQAQAAAYFAAASVKNVGTNSGEAFPDETRTQQIINQVSQPIRPRLMKRLSEARVLWVDDRPQNNVYERKALEALGISFTISTSTEDALDKLSRYQYDAIISDMGRPPDAQAGYTLLAEKRKLHDDTPFIIYAGSNKPEHKAQAREAGAIGSTNDPLELYDLVLKSIASQA